MMERVAGALTLAAVVVMGAVVFELPESLPSWEQSSILVAAFIILEVMGRDWARALHDHRPEGE